MDEHPAPAAEEVPDAKRQRVEDPDTTAAATPPEPDADASTTTATATTTSAAPAVAEDDPTPTVIPTDDGAGDRVGEVGEAATATGTATETPTVPTPATEATTVSSVVDTAAPTTDTATATTAATATTETSAATPAATPAATATGAGAGKKGKQKPSGDEDNAGPALAIPKNAVKRIMKLEDDVKQVQAEAVLLVAKATELFLEKFARDAHKIAIQQDRKQVKYSDLFEIRERDANLNFLKCIVPEPKIEEEDA